MSGVWSSTVSALMRVVRKRCTIIGVFTSLDERELFLFTIGSEPSGRMCMFIRFE
jgi:hypothetical protein